MKNILGKNLYDVKEVANILGVSTTTVHLYIKNKVLDARKFAGKWHIDENTIKEYTGINDDKNKEPYQT